MKKHLIAALLVAAPLCASAQTAIPTGPNGPVVNAWTGIPMTGDCGLDATARITCKTIGGQMPGQWALSR